MDQWEDPEVEPVEQKEATAEDKGWLPLEGWSSNRSPVVVVGIVAGGGGVAVLRSDVLAKGDLALLGFDLLHCSIFSISTRLLVRGP